MLALFTKFSSQTARSLCAKMMQRERVSARRRVDHFTIQLQHFLELHPMCVQTLRDSACFLLIGCSTLMTSPLAAQSVLFAQPVVPGGILRNSALWVDPAGQNDLDSDAIAYENFTLTETALVTHVKWVGEALPPLGFEVTFYNQDPGTIASQPDIFHLGWEPIAQAVYPTPAVSSASGLYEFSIALEQPIVFQAGVRYFVSVVGLTPVPFAGWGWAKGEPLAGSTFYWSRGAHMYFNMPENRALTLLGTTSFNHADLDQNGLVNGADLTLLLADWGCKGSCVGDIDMDGRVSATDLSQLLSSWG
jgi:hypothetical protein